MSRHGQRGSQQACRLVVSHPGCMLFCRVCSLVFTRSNGWNSRVEQVPLREPHMKAFRAGWAWGNKHRKTEFEQEQGLKEETKVKVRKEYKWVDIKCGVTAEEKSNGFEMNRKIRWWNYSLREYNSGSTLKGPYSTLFYYFAFPLSPLHMLVQQKQL